MLAGRSKAETYYLQPTTGGSPFDWNSTADPYYSWWDISATQYRDIPSNGATVFLYQAGTNGVSNTTVNMNYAYAGTNAITSFYIDSGDAISQTSSTSLMNTTSNCFVGYFSGSGQYSQSAGTTTIGGWLYIGDYAGTFGTYTLSGSGTLNVNNGIEEVGQNGVGIFNHSGGINNVSTLVVGNNLVSGSYGTYNMSNGATINVSQNLSVGDSGLGSFNMTGGTINVGTNGTLGLIVGDYAGASGTFTLSVGNIKVGGYQGEYIGNGGSGLFTQMGGSNLTYYLTISNASTAAGTYTLSGGLLQVTSDIIVGHAAPGSFTQTGGTVSCSVLELSQYGASSIAGFYTISNGATLNIGSGLSIFYGLFNQLGGSVIQTTSNLDISADGPSTNAASYHISGGTLSTPGQLVVAEGNQGSFIQSGGSVSSYVIQIATYAGSYGVYSLSGTGQVSTTLVEMGEYGGTGILNLNGGSFTATSNMYVGEGTLGASGTINLSSGTLTSLGSEYVGFSGTGQISQNGGVNIAGPSVGGTNGLYLGFNTGSTGSYNLSAGLLSVSNSAYVGYSGAGSFVQSGGTNQSYNLFIAGAGTAVGSYSMSNGFLTVSNDLVVSNGTGTTATFTQTGGTANVLGTFIGDGYLNSTGVFNLVGGTFNAPGGIVLNSGGIFNGNTNGLSGASAPILNAAYFTQQGGVVNGVLQNQGTFHYMSGSFNGQLLNQGTVLLDVDFTAGNGIYNLPVTPLTIASNRTVTLNGSGLLNDGTVILNGTLNAGVENIGYTSTGNFTQNSGSNVVSQFTLGENAGSTGYYQLSGGLLNAYTSTVGAIGNGYFTQSGGTNQSGNLVLGSVGTATGSYSISGGALSTGLILVNFNSTSTSSFSVSGSGAVTASGSVIFGYIDGGALYNQSGGVFSAGTNGVCFGYANTAGSVAATLSGGTFNSIAPEYVGYGSTATFTQTGGTNSITGTSAGAAALYLAYLPSVSGSYSQSNGLLSVSGASYVGFGGTGLFSQSGGTHTATSLYVSYSNGASGTYALSGGLLNVSGTSYVGYGGTGLFNQTGGSNTTAALYIAYTNGASGTYSLSAGVLTSNATVNRGQFTQSGGTASLGTVTGSGTMTLGGALELTKVTNFQQSAITISSGGYLAVASNAARATNTVMSLTITGSGQLDLANQYLLTNTPSNSIRQYLINGYHNGAWNGTGGISSINANASYNIPASNGGHLTALGYSTGTHSALGISLGLATNQTVIKYTIYGDANLDGTVDINDLNTVLSNYLSGNPGTWDTGDFNYDGATDISDLNVILNNYLANAPTTVRTAAAKASAASTAKTLTGTVSPADTVNPLPANGVLELVVNVVSGDVELEGNNADIASLQITSNSGGIITANWTDLKSNGYANWTDTAKKKTGIGEFDNQFTVSGDYAVLGVVDYGDIYNTSANAEDYVFKYGSVESNDTTVDTDVGSVVYVGVPEPTTLGLLGLAAAGLMGRRRRNRV